MKHLPGIGMILGLALAGPNCWLSLCMKSVGPDSTYDVDVEAPYVDGGTYRFVPNGGSYFMSMGSCSSVDGIAAGTTLRFKGVGTMSDQPKACVLVFALVVSFFLSVLFFGLSS